jgi:hypothetical protein
MSSTTHIMTRAMADTTATSVGMCRFSMARQCFRSFGVLNVLSCICCTHSMLRCVADAVGRPPDGLLSWFCAGPAVVKAIIVTNCNHLG